MPEVTTMPEPTLPERLRAALHDGGIPDDFAVVPAAQLVPRSTARGIDELIEVFERVTTRPSWQRALLARNGVPAWAHEPHREVCFFSAWDIHVPHDDRDAWKLIEVNDNGSGLLFAAVIDRAYYDVAGVGAEARIDAPPTYAQLAEHVAAMIDQEATTFFGERPRGLVFILDDADSLARGHFRAELDRLAVLVREHGWEAAIGAPDELVVRDGRLDYRGRDVRFVVNRSTDFLWQGDAFAALRTCFANGSVYVAPNPVTYLTRSDKQLLELLSDPAHDVELGILPDERAVLAARVPETHVLREANLDALAARKHELFFKPARGYASHGTIAGANVGRSRLHRLLRDGELYVAQRFVDKGRLAVPGVAEPMQTDLRVWAYRGARYLMAGRAVQSEERRDPRAGGWVATFVADDAAL
jgi:hypothetical protein